MQLQSDAGLPVELNAEIDYGARQAVSTVNYRARMVRDGRGQVRPGAVCACAEINFTFH